MVMGGESCSEGCGFESKYCILYTHLTLYTVCTFFTLICCKNCNVCSKKSENEKEAGDGRFVEIRTSMNIEVKRKIYSQKIFNVNRFYYVPRVT